MRDREAEAYDTERYAVRAPSIMRSVRFDDLELAKSWAERYARDARYTCDEQVEVVDLIEQQTVCWYESVWKQRNVLAQEWSFWYRVEIETRKAGLAILDQLGHPKRIIAWEEVEDWHRMMMLTNAAVAHSLARQTQQI